MNSKEDLDDFRAFCENATTKQLPAIVEKENAGGRYAYAAIAQAVLNGR